MMLPEADAAATDPTALAAFADARGTIGKLLPVAALQAGLFLLLLSATTLVARQPGRLPALDEYVHDGSAGLVGAALLIALTATLTCLLLAWGRHRTLRWSSASDDARPPELRRSGIAAWTGMMFAPILRRRARFAPVTRCAGWPQALLILTGMACAVLLIHAYPPLPGRSGIAVLLLVPAFLLLVCERIVAALQADRLPETARLSALLRLPALVLLALAATDAAAQFGVFSGLWPAVALRALLLAVSAELALRTLGIWFLPLPAPTAARAAIGSLIAALLQPGALRPTEMAQRMRAQFGIDISRSWAVTYMRAAVAPVLVGLLLVAWGLSGVARIGQDERGSYERFGAPVAVLRPGLHVVLPWPFGRVRRVEYGVIHAMPVGRELSGVPAPVDTSTADGAPPPSANRLWDEQPGSDNTFLIASGDPGRQSFETVSADMRVLYRIGLDDESARRALYASAAPDALVRALADRLLDQFFAKRTLTEVLGERREQVATQLRRELQSELDERRSGIEVVAVVVESMHPPGGAAQAYRSVQAAQIIASTQRAEEIGRAQGTLNVAGRDAHDARDHAEAAAAEMVDASEVDRTQADADTRAYREGGRAFLLERYFLNLRIGLADAALEIVDNRLGHPDAPLIDLRPAEPPQQGATTPEGSR